MKDCNPLFVTTLLEKQQKKTKFNEMQSKKDQEKILKQKQNGEEENNENKFQQQSQMQPIFKDNNQVENFFPVATYCKAIVQEIEYNSFQIQVTGLHRVELEEAYQVNLKNKDVNGLIKTTEVLKGYYDLTINDVMKQYSENGQIRHKCEQILERVKGDIKYLRSNIKQLQKEIEENKFKNEEDLQKAKKQFKEDQEKRVVLIKFRQNLGKTIEQKDIQINDLQENKESSVQDLQKDKQDNQQQQQAEIQIENENENENEASIDLNIEKEILLVSESKIIQEQMFEQILEQEKKSLLEMVPILQDYQDCQQILIQKYKSLIKEYSLNIIFESVILKMTEQYVKFWLQQQLDMRVEAKNINEVVIKQKILENFNQIKKILMESLQHQEKSYLAILKNLPLEKKIDFNIQNLQNQEKTDQSDSENKKNDDLKLQNKREDNKEDQGDDKKLNKVQNKQNIKSQQLLNNLQNELQREINLGQNLSNDQQVLHYEILNYIKQQSQDKINEQKKSDNQKMEKVQELEKLDQQIKAQESQSINKNINENEEINQENQEKEINQKNYEKEINGQNQQQNQQQQLFEEEENEIEEPLLENQYQQLYENLTEREKQRQLQMEELEKNFYIVKQKMIQDTVSVKLNVGLEYQLMHLLQTYSKIMSQNLNQVQLTNYNLNDGYRIADSLGGFLVDQNYFTKVQLYKAYSQIPLQARVEKIQELFYQYQGFINQFQKLGKEARDLMFYKKYEKYQREIYELVKQKVKGENRKQQIIKKLENNILNKKLPEEVQEIYTRQMERFKNLPQNSQESNIVLTYLEWLTQMPFGIKSQDNFDIKQSRKILDQHHYGMRDAKDSILEFIAVGKLKGNLKGKILLLVGPPGVGKTSLASSIAKSLNRKFSRVSCGGETDEAFLKGHRKTYIGSYPGKIAQSLKECGTENCVILLDEIDKLGGNSYRGDPQQNLLEILDPEQNNTFVDNYLDFKLDLSNVLFICSANITDSISEPLLDRMDVIQLSSYTHLEKKEIYKNYLYPKIIEQTGMEEKKELFDIPENIVDIIINDYCRESGIRSLEKTTKQIIEKIAYQIIKKQEAGDILLEGKSQEYQLLQEEKEEKQKEDQFQIEHENNHLVYRVTEENLVKLIGFPKFKEDNLYTENPPPGVIIGLAYTQYGGSLLYLEAVVGNRYDNQKIGGLKVTGNLGDVMKESSQIAYTFAKNFCHQKLNNDFLTQNIVHIHAPEGAIPKDGPSAGVTLVTSLISLAQNKPMKKKIGMTGEISLLGQVMKIGGVKEKTLAAKREGVFDLIFPESNREDVEELDDEIKEGINFNFVQNYDQVYKILFEDD